VVQGEHEEVLSCWEVSMPFHVICAKKNPKVKRNSKKSQKLPLKFPQNLMQASFPVTENKF